MKLLVAVDLSSSTDRVLDTVEGLAKSLSAKLWLVHVAAPDPDFVGWEAGPQTSRDAQAVEFRDQHRRVQDMADRLRGNGVEATALLIQGATADKILREAAKIDADMVVVGSHGHGTAYHLIVGSVSEAVLRESTCPVLVVPTHDRD